MKKRICFAFLTISILVFSLITPAYAEVIPSRGQGQIGLQAVVLCDKLTVRQDPDAGSPEVMTLNYGDTFITTQDKGKFADVILSDDVDAGPEGWVNWEYIFIDPAWYVTEGKTPVYAWNDTNAPKVALLDAGEKLPILKDDGTWYTVSLRGASGWIPR